MSLDAGRHILGIMKRSAAEEYAKYRHDYEKCDAATVAHVVDAMANRLEVTTAEAQVLLNEEGWRSSFDQGRPATERALMDYSSSAGAAPSFNAPLPPGATASRLGGFRDWDG